MEKPMKTEEDLPEMVELKLSIERDAYLQIRNSMLIKHMTQGMSSFHEACMKLIIGAIEEDNDILIITVHGEDEEEEDSEDEKLVEKGEVGTAEVQKM